MRWMLWTPQIIETTDGRSREQVIQDLIREKIIRGAADAFYLDEIIEWTADAECGAAGEESEELDTTGETAEK